MWAHSPAPCSRKHAIPRPRASHPPQHVVAFSLKIDPSSKLNLRSERRRCIHHNCLHCVHASFLKEVWMLMKLFPEALHTSLLFSGLFYASWWWGHLSIKMSTVCCGRRRVGPRTLQAGFRPPNYWWVTIYNKQPKEMLFCCVYVSAFFLQFNSWTINSLTAQRCIQFGEVSTKTRMTNVGLFGHR